MKETDRFQLKTLHASTAETPAALLSDGTRSAQLCGTALEAQFSVVPDRYLLVLTDGNPFEETLRFHLLDAELRSLDTLAVDAPYQSLVVKDVQADGERSILLRVNDGTRFRLAVNGSPLNFLQRFAARMAGKRCGTKGLLVFQID